MKFICKEVHLYYVYALLDPRKPGHYCYTLPSGKIATFSHEPFYMGKGKGDRMYSHVKDALRASYRRCGYDAYKDRKIRSIHKAGYEVIHKQSTCLYDEQTAFELENSLVAVIGRHDMGQGPLTNLTDGGDGPVRQNAKARHLRRLSFIDWWNSLTQAEYEAFCSRKVTDFRAWQQRVGSDEVRRVMRERALILWNTITPKRRLEYSAKQSTSVTRFWSTLSEADRKTRAAKIQRTISAKTAEEKELTRQRRSEAAKRAYATLPILTCPHCKKQGKGSTMSWKHFDNCADS